MEDPDTAHQKENVLAAQVEAALQGHDLGEFEQVQEEDYKLGYEAHCKKCGKSVCVNHKIIHSILESKCPGSKRGRK
jgi:hypothetical protein